MPGTTRGGEGSSMVAVRTPDLEVEEVANIIVQVAARRARGPQSWVQMSAHRYGLDLLGMQYNYNTSIIHFYLQCCKCTPQLKSANR